MRQVQSLADRAARAFAMLLVVVGATGSTAVRAQFWQKDTPFAPVLESPEIPIEQKFTAVVRQPDGKLLVAGYVERVNGQGRANPTAPLRFNANGTLDATFQASEPAHRLYLQPSGKIVTAEGVRLNANGSRDVAFQLTSPFFKVETVDSLGRLYVRRGDGSFFRTTPDGVDDAQFNTDLRPRSGSAIAPFADGSVAIATVIAAPYFSPLTIIRLRADGSQDPDFTPYVDSIQEQDFLGLVVLPDGRVLLYGTTLAQFGVTMRFVRLGLDGLPDYTYIAPPLGGSGPQAPDALTLGGVLYDVLQDANAAAGTRVRATIFPSDIFTANIDVGVDGTLWLGTGAWGPGILERYSRSSTTELTIDPRPILLVDTVSSPIELLLGQSRALIAPMPGGLLPVTYQWRKDGTPIPAATNASLRIGAQSTSDTGSYTVEMSNAYGSVTSAPRDVVIDATPAPLTITRALEGRAVEIGAGLLWWTYATGNPFPTFSWTRNGASAEMFIARGSSDREANSSVQINDVQPEHTGIYETIVVSGNSSQLMRAILGVLSDEKNAGAASEVRTDIVHPNKNVYDQVLLSGASAAITADAGQITRISFVDLTNDIVQVELSGSGTLALVLENAGTPAPPANYNQAGVLYVRGHPGIVVAGADETTNVAVFSVGRANAVDQALFRDEVDYDGVADVAFIAITTTNGRFGSLRTGNVEYYASKGVTGVYAPGVVFEGPVFVGDIDAFDAATPAFVFRSAQELRVTGGDLLQTNGNPVLVGEQVPSTFTAGTTSHGDLLPAQTNRATFEPEDLP